MALRRCTCLVETESDSDDDETVAVEEKPRKNSNSKSNMATTPLNLSRVTSRGRDPIKASHALHNSEAFRQAHHLQNVFCACYDMETVLNMIQRREQHTNFSPVQAMLLEPENIVEVFAFATSVEEIPPSTSASKISSQSSSLSSSSSSSSLFVYSNSTPDPDPERYRRSVIATEIILRFYLKAMAWHGSPRPDPTSMDLTVSRNSNQRNGDAVVEPEMEQKASSPRRLSPLLGFNKSQLSRRLSSWRTKNSYGSFSSDTSDNLAIRGYVLRLEDLTVSEWKRIFMGLYQFLWKSNSSSDTSGDIDSSNVVKPKWTATVGGKDEYVDDEPIDSVLISNMCRITKNLAVFPSVNAILNSLDDDGRESLYSRLAMYAYNPDVSSLLLGLIHLAQRKHEDFLPIVRSIVHRIIEYQPFTRPARAISASSSSSTSSSTSSFSSATASSSLTSSIFSLKKSLIHERISGCAEILTKILTQQFPNTFRYYVQTKIQLASFESVEPFERELFPIKMRPNDPVLHEQLKSAVLTSLLETPDVLIRLADLGIAELRYLDANYTCGAGIPTVLVIDIFKSAIECSLDDCERLELFVAPVQVILDTLCATINYHQHLSTISEFASRDCFSDSDSDDASDPDDGEEEYLEKEDRIPSPPSLVLPLRISSPRASFGLMDRYSSNLGTMHPPKHVVNHRPLASVLLVTQVVDLLDAIIQMGIDAVDSRLARLDLSTSLIDIFEKFSKANILHCRLVKLYLNMFDRTSTNAHVTNPLLRSVFRPPDSILAFIMHKLHTSTSSHPYDAHLAIIGVKIDKICSSPTLEQELIPQYCNSYKGWAEFCSTLVANHYQQMDALDDSLIGLSATPGAGGTHPGARGRRGSSDSIDDVFPLARPSSSASEYLSRELEPFRRLPIEKEGFGSSHNRASGNEGVHPTDMFRSRSQSQYPESIIDILRGDTTTSFDAEEDERFIAGYAYQKRAKWAKVHLRFDKDKCELVVEEASSVSKAPTGTGSTSDSKTLSTSKLKQFLMSQKKQWGSRPTTFVVCNARKWIAFGRSVKNPGVGAFGFQVEVFDRLREQDKTLTFVTRSDLMRTLWFEAMQFAVMESRTVRNSLTDEDEEANIMLVNCVATNREGSTRSYLVVPDVHLLGPMISSNFFLKSEVPEELPFWGTYHGANGVAKYVSLLNRSVKVVAVEEKRTYASNYSVIVEFDATFERAETCAHTEDHTRSPTKPRMRKQMESTNSDKKEIPNVKCSCTDTYLISGNQVIGLTRTIADSEKLLRLLSDEDEE